MKKFLFLLATLAVTVTAQFSPIDIVLRSHLPANLVKTPKNFTPSPSISAHFLSQRVNHFDPQNTQRFNQRYFLNDEFFTPGGPIIVYLHAYPNDNTSLDYLSIGPVHDLARNVSGLLVHAHHRYFLDSLVFPEMTRESLRFCTVSQAIEDVAHLVSYLRRNFGGLNDDDDDEKYEYNDDNDSYDNNYKNNYYNNNNNNNNEKINKYNNNTTPIILIGWDYGASIASWFAQRHPHLVNGIWASAVRLDPRLGHEEPVHRVESVMKRAGDECFSRIENGFREFEEMIVNNRSNVIRRRFNFCFSIPHMHGDYDVMYFYNLMVTLFYAYAEFYDEAIFAQIFCPALMNAPVEEDWEAIGYLYGLLDIPVPLCYPNSVEWQIEIMRDNNQHGTLIGMAQAYIYLQCADFGFFYNSGDGTSVFGAKWPQEFFAFICREAFGFTESQMIENFRLFNTLHGGRRPVIPNAYFTVGELYPWINQTIDPDAVHPTSFYEVVPGRSLHTELSLILNNPAFDEVRERVFAAIRQWLEL